MIDNNKIKVGMNLYLWLTRLEPKHFPLLAELSAAGFDGVEIPTGDYSPDEVRDIRVVLNDQGLACTVATLLAPPCNPISEQLSERKMAREKLSRDIETALSLGAEALIGPVHSAHKHFAGRGPNEREFDRCVEFLHWAGEQLRASDIYLAVEPLNRFECYFLNTAQQARRLSEALAHPQVGILYDTHHANIEEADAYEAVTSLGSHLRHFHVSESHRGTPGSGAVDWESSFRALRDADYRGWLVIEAFATDVPGIPEAVNIWRDCFADKREVYRQGLRLIKSAMVNA